MRLESKNKHLRALRTINGLSEHELFSADNKVCAQFKEDVAE